MTFWTYQNLADVTDGTWLVKPDDLGDAVAGLWHDTRDIKPGQAYLAIKGDNFDGHEFLDQAFEAGAALAIVSDPNLKPQASSPTLCVEDTVTALQGLARAYRDELAQSGCKVIGIAGSNGKTTTRHLIHHVLTHAGLKGIQSPKSFNNHLGVPLTLLQAKPSDDFVAAEIGTNHPGEIDFLSAIARPDIAVITSIGEEHLEFFKDLEGVAEEESSILNYIQEGGALISPGHWDIPITGMLYTEWLERLPKGSKSIRVGQFMETLQDKNARIDWLYWSGIDQTNVEQPQRFPVELCDCQAPNAEPVLSGEIELNMSGWHNIPNALYSVAVAAEMGVSFDSARKSLVSVIPPEGRSEVLRIGSITILNDAYNANPQSMHRAIDTLSSWGDINPPRKIAILGDMFELGDQAEELHRQVVNHLASLDPTKKYSFGKLIGAIEQVVLIGSFMAVATEPIETRWAEAGRNHLTAFPEWSDDLPDQIAALLQPGDTVLLKASRGMRLERLIPAIERRFGPAQDDQPT